METDSSSKDELINDDDNNKCDNQVNINGAIEGSSSTVLISNLNETSITSTNSSGLVDTFDTKSEPDTQKNSPAPGLMDEANKAAKLKELNEIELLEKEKRIRKLKALLRNEENKLTLMKKIKQSQLMKENISSSSPTSSLISGSAGTPSSVVGPPIGLKSNGPSPHLGNAPTNLSNVSISKTLPHAHNQRKQTGLPGHHLSIHGLGSLHSHHPQHLSTPPAHSHSHHHSTPPAHSQSLYSTPPAHSGSSHHHQQSAHQQAHAQQPPLIQAAHQSRSNAVLNPPITNNRSINSYGALHPPPLGMSSHRTSGLSAPVHHGPPTNNQHQSSLRPGYNSTHRNPMTTPPNVVIGYPVQDLRAQQSISHSSNQVKPVRQSEFHGARNACSSPSNEINQTPAQRLASAKLALRKQLEKTLLQIVPPKPPPPETHFIPNANNNEFIYYYGLETIVDFLTGTDQNKPPPEPFECVQCGSDFTPIWKWQDRIDPKRGKPAVICESCVSYNIKKKLREEHTKRLKTAFVKALQQEKEIEQRISSGAPSPPVPASTPPNTLNSSSAPQAAVTAAAAVVRAAGLTNSHGNSGGHGLASSTLLPQAPPAHSSFPRHGSAAAAAAASANAAAALAASSALFSNLPKLTPAQQSLLQAQFQQLAQSLPRNFTSQGVSQPQPAHMLPFAPLFYQYGALMNGKLGGVNGVPNDLHRQYLLDMIPPRSLGQNSGLNWKT